MALLRGINVGGNNKIGMSELKQCFESLGYNKVSTYINSGNVIFESPKTEITELAGEIETAIKEAFSLDISVVIRDKNNIEKICRKIPADWVNNKDYKTDVMFLWPKFASRNTLEQIRINPLVDTLLYIEGAIVWHLKKEDYGKSKMGDIIGTSVYKNMTVRNINTVRKLASLMKEG